MVLADQAFAAGFSAAMSGGMIGWAITLACYAGIIVAAVPFNWKKIAPTWNPTNDPTVKPVDSVLTIEAKQFIEARKKLEAAIIAETAAKEANAKAHDANIAKLEADKRTAEALIIVGEQA